MKLDKCFTITDERIWTGRCVTWVSIQRSSAKVFVSLREQFKRNKKILKINKINMHTWIMVHCGCPPVSSICTKFAPRCIWVCEYVRRSYHLQQDIFCFTENHHVNLSGCCRQHSFWLDAMTFCYWQDRTRPRLEVVTLKLRYFWQDLNPVYVTI